MYSLYTQISKRCSQTKDNHIIHPETIYFMQERRPTQGNLENHSVKWQLVVFLFSHICNIIIENVEYDINVQT